MIWLIWTKRGKEILRFIPDFMLKELIKVKGGIIR